MQTTRETLSAVRINAGQDRIENLTDATTELMEEAEECAGAIGMPSSALEEESIEEELMRLRLPNVNESMEAVSMEPLPSLPDAPEPAPKPTKAIEEEMLSWAEHS